MGATCSLGLCQNDKAGEENLTYDIVKKPIVEYEKKNEKFYVRTNEYTNEVRDQIKDKRFSNPSIKEYTNGNVQIINM